ncbi:MAG: D-tyrosyl-tRNA(Tyr) deacylase [Ignavibacteria bacterium]|nr:D-tyrosyl-tRNA(Tyr) deacylase [Ignavibacteria bacterium]MBI3765718.1 D-tyrosyl-tRNA(Tyr) deacylase [Ignavibacteriales bacterium]
MRALLQRVKDASVTINGGTHNEIGKGLLIFLGVGRQDTHEDANYLAQRCATLRIFEDEQKKMNLSVKDIAGNVLVISQFTLYADTRKGNRPSFTDAALPDAAEVLYEQFVNRLRTELGESKVRTGVFRAMMDIQLTNDGPVTIMVESKEKER